MNNEIERKFLVKDFDIEKAEEKYEIKQGYIHSESGKVVRVRTFGDKGYITVKVRKTKLTRAEFEYEIPYSDAINMLENCCEGRVLYKTRYIYFYENKKWEIDIFEGKNKGIILAEIELSDENETFEIPLFVTKEVTNNPKYSNHNMANE